ncbi:MAG: ABC transporter substrate-binding protein [Gaiellaceae bacterium]
MRGIALKAILALAACAVLVVTLGSSSGSKASSTLIFAGAADPTYLDPALASDGETFRVTEQMYEGLVALKPGTTKVIPKLATRWKSTNRGRTWTFWLRRGVKFHDGTPFNSAAVCTNFNRWYNWSGPFQDPSATFYYQAIYGGFKHNEVSGLQPPLYRSCAAKGAYKAVIKLRKASGTFFPSLVIAPFAMQSPTAMRRYGADQGELRNGTFRATGSYAFEHPTGTGPFKFKSWTIGQKVEIVRNDAYWGKKSRLSRVIIQPISDATARLQALQNHDINAYDLAAPQDIPTLAGNSSLKVVKRPAFNVAYVTIHQGPGSPMNDLKVRQAVAYGLNRAAVVKNFYYGTGVVANEFQPPSLFGYSKKVAKYPYNPTKAKQLLNSSSCHVPCKVDFWYPTAVTRPYMPDPQRNFEAFSASLEASGFNVVAHSAPWRPTYVPKVNEGSAGDLNLIGWTGDYGDPDNFLGTFFRNFNPQFGFNNSAITGILNRALNQPNFKKRVALYQRANQIIMKYLPGVPYAHATPALGAEKRVQKLIATPVGGVWFQFAGFGGQ